MTAATAGSTTARSGEPMTKPADEAMPEAMTKAVVEVVEALHDDNRRRQAEIPGRAEPIWKEIGIGVVDRIRIGIGIGIGGGRRRQLINLRRQPRRILRDLPAAVRLRARLDHCLLRLAADGDRRRVAAARRLV